MDAALLAVAEGQDGLFTTAQARSAGIGEMQLAGLKESGLVVSVARSVYALPDAVPSDPLDAHRVKVRAGRLVYPDAYPCGVSLLADGGIDVWGAELRRADLVRAVRSEVLTSLCRIRPPHATVRPAPGSGDAVAAAVVQTALDHGPLAGIVSADDALHDGVTTASAIEAVARSIVRWPGAGKVRTMLAMMDGRSESVGESRLRVLLTVAGLRLIPQFPITDGGEAFAFVDLLVDGTNLCLEFDGRMKYGEPDVLWREKKREDRIRRRGYRLERVIWADFGKPKVLLARVRHEVALAEVRPSVLLPVTASGA
jgi:hypothetical protein